VISKGLHQQVRKLEKLQSCDSCNRILVPFTYVTYVKEEVDPLLVSEEERIAMEERGELGQIPACKNCEGELYENKELKQELKPAADCSSFCPKCYSFIVPISLEDEDDN
jgi:RNase P subunit RPR2